MSVSGYLPAYCLTGQNTVPAPEIKPNQSRYGDLLPNDAVEFPKKDYSREVPGTFVYLFCLVLSTQSEN